MLCIHEVTVGATIAAIVGATVAPILILKLVLICYAGLHNLS
jgi:hypothetical protein